MPLIYQRRPRVTQPPPSAPLNRVLLNGGTLLHASFGRHVVNSVTGQIRSTNSGTEVGTPNGEALRFVKATGQGARQADLSANFALPVTLTALVVRGADTGNSCAVSIGNGTGSLMLLLGPDYIEAGYWSGSSYRSWRATTSALEGVLASVTVRFNDTSTFEVFRDGQKLTATNNISGTPGGYSNFTRVFVGAATHGTGDNFAGDVLFAAVGTLTDSQIANIGSNPWQLFADEVRLVPYSASSDATLSVSDAGTGADASAMAVAAAAQDSGTGADASAIAAALAGDESGTGADVVLPAPAVPGADTGTGGDTASAAVAIGATDAASGADTVSVDTGSADQNIARTDSATGADSASVAVTEFAVSVSDSGAGADAASVAITALNVSVSDAAAGGDAAAVEKTGEPLPEPPPAATGFMMGASPFPVREPRKERKRKTYKGRDAAEIAAERDLLRQLQLPEAEDEADAPLSECVCVDVGTLAESVMIARYVTERGLLRTAPGWPRV